MILVTGANGHLGRGIAEHLAARLGPAAAQQLAVSVRDPAKAQALAERGIDVRHGDFDQPDTLARAFAGVERLVLVSTDGPKDVRIAQHRTAIHAARAAGVKRIHYTSFVDVAADSPAEFTAVHRATEAELRASGLDVVLLRNPLYADYLPMTVGNALESGVFYVSAGAGRASFVSRDELAEAAAVAALKDHHEKNIYELTGPAVHSYHDVAAALGRATGKSVRYQPVTEDAYAEALANYGVPAWMARALANMYSAMAAGKFDRVTDDYVRLVGRAPRPLDAQIEHFFAQAIPAR